MNKVKLKTEYISVNEGNRISIGGNQEYFKNYPGFFSKYKYGNGCGIVALGDTLLYLKGCDGDVLHSRGVSYGKTFDSIASYRSFFDEIVHLTHWIPTRFGVTNILLTVWFNMICKSQKIDRWAYWGCSRKHLYGRVARMLKEDIPVILCIPYVLNPKRKKTALLTMYGIGTKNQRVNSHFVTVIGLTAHDDKRFYKVSSWGKCYEIDVDEYDEFMKSLLFGNMLGNALIVH